MNNELNERELNAVKGVIEAACRTRGINAPIKVKGFTNSLGKYSIQVQSEDIAMTPSIFKRVFVNSAMDVDIVEHSNCHGSECTAFAMKCNLWVSCVPFMTYGTSELIGRMNIVVSHFPNNSFFIHNTNLELPCGNTEGEFYCGDN